MRSSEELRLDDQLCFALYAATNAVTRAYRPLLQKLDLTYPQYLVMMVVWQEGPCSIGRIAERLKLGSNAITPLVDRLEGSGLIARRRDVMDRRAVLVEATPAGEQLQRSAVVAQHEVVCRTGLSPTRLASLREDLHDLVNQIATGDPGGEANVSLLLTE